MADISLHDLTTAWDVLSRMEHEEETSLDDFKSLRRAKDLVFRREMKLLQEKEAEKQKAPDAVNAEGKPRGGDPETKHQTV